MSKQHVGIAGCGPAGLAVALFLHRLGLRVTLIDQLEVPAPVGSGFILQPTGLAVLRELGLDEIARGLAYPIDRIHGRVFPTGRTVLDVHYGALGHGIRGYAIHRAALFNTLYEAVQTAGLEVITHAKVCEVHTGADGRPGFLTDKGNRIGPFDWAVDALGARSTLRAHCFGTADYKKLPFGALWASLQIDDPCVMRPFNGHTLEQVYERANRMIGVLPVGATSATSGFYASFFWSLRADALESWRKMGLDSWKEEVIWRWPETEGLLQLIHHPDELVFAQYGHHTMPVPYHGRLVFLGDAAHASSPQLGQGVNMALLDAFALYAALKKLGDAEEAFKAYSYSRKAHVRFYQALSWFFTPVYQSESRLLPLLRDNLFSLALRLPYMPDLLAHMVGGTLVPPTRKMAELNL